jgi:pantoate kinase
MRLISPVPAAAGLADPELAKATTSTIRRKLAAYALLATGAVAELLGSGVGLVLSIWLCAERPAGQGWAVSAAQSCGLTRTIRTRCPGTA